MSSDCQATSEAKSSDASKPYKDLVAALKPESTVRVDVNTELRKLGLGDLSEELAPPGPLVDELASELSKLRGKGVQKPFVKVDLRKWLPFWGKAAGAEGESHFVNRRVALISSMLRLLPGESDKEDEELSKEMKELAKAMGANTSKAKRELTPFQWSLAFDYFALGAAAVNMLSYKAALAHKVCPHPSHC